MGVNFQRGITSNLPTIGEGGSFYLTTDTNELYVCHNDNNTLNPVTTQYSNLINKPFIEVGSDINSIKAGTSSANSYYDVSIGENNIVGCKGYYWYYMTASTKAFRVSTVQSSGSSTDFNMNWEVGDTLSLVNDVKYPASCKIVSIEHKSLTSSTAGKLYYYNIIVDELPFTSKASVSEPDVEDFAIINIDKPQSGVISFGWTSMCIGRNNLVTAKEAFCSGYGNKLLGDFGMACGTQNTVGYISFASGTGNNILGGQCNAAFGTKNTIAGRNSIVSGYSNNITGNYSFVTSGIQNTIDASYVAAIGSSNQSSYDNTILIGNGLISGKTNQIVLGQYNESNTSAALVFGIGTSSAPKTAFTVTTAGNIALYVEPNDAQNRHVVNVKYVKDKLSNYYTSTQIDNFLSVKCDADHTHSEYALSSHNHNSLYYTKAEIDALIAGLNNGGSDVIDPDPGTEDTHNCNEYATESIIDYGDCQTHSTYDLVCSKCGTTLQSNVEGDYGPHSYSEGESYDAYTVFNCNVVGCDSSYQQCNNCGQRLDSGNCTCYFCSDHGFVDKVTCENCGEYIDACPDCSSPLECDNCGTVQDA